MRYLLFILCAVGLCMGSTVGSAATKCTMTFTMKSWSFVYKSDKGTGTIRCDNGQSARVKLRGHGGGFTVGKNRILEGRGEFSPVANIHELYGTYAKGEAHGGVGESGQAQGLTKGDISLTLTGTGTGVNVGVDVGSLSIKPIGKSR